VLLLLGSNAIVKTFDFDDELDLQPSKIAKTTKE
jgi:hypothetical protein